MFNLAVVVIAIAAIFSLHVAFKAVGEKTRSARFAQAVIGLVALVIGWVSIVLIF